MPQRPVATEQKAKRTDMPATIAGLSARDGMPPVTQAVAFDARTMRIYAHITRYLAYAVELRGLPRYG